uniref:Uncharacterized protein n=1 Tax=Corvus moneduloides TaxID=1196302 RepID=A0A8C3ER77_CORMO
AQTFCCEAPGFELFTWFSVMSMVSVAVDRHKPSFGFAFLSGPPSRWFGLSRHTILLMYCIFYLIKAVNLEKRNKFIASGFLTEWLYNKNPKKKDESFTELFSIPFVKDWLKDHPRPPIPLSLLISEEEASILIQSFWRGYRVRCDSEIQELRQWQKKLREERHINKIVKEFWTKQEAKGK